MNRRFLPKECLICCSTIKYLGGGNDVEKNKDVEVRIEEMKKDIKGKNYKVIQLFIGEKMIGKILAYGPKEYEIFFGGEDFEKEESLENTIETMIRCRNLHE